jgi:hypothetical protein
LGFRRVQGERRAGLSQLRKGYHARLARSPARRLGRLPRGHALPRMPHGQHFERRRGRNAQGDRVGASTLSDSRRIELCASCGARMKQLHIEAAPWTLGELAADLARCSEDDETWLIWYGECPNACRLCFCCPEWLGKDETCPRCPLCPRCGRPHDNAHEDDDGIETDRLGASVVPIFRTTRTTAS